MGLFFRRSQRVGKNTRVNYSRRGASVSRRFGPFTINSRGRVSLRLGRGLNISKRL